MAVWEFELYSNSYTNQRQLTLLKSFTSYLKTNGKTSRSTFNNGRTKADNPAKITLTYAHLISVDKDNKVKLLWDLQHLYVIFVYSIVAQWTSDVKN